MIFIAALSFLLGVYAILFLIPAFRWRSETESKDYSADSNVLFSIIIPVRNEEANIVECIDSILRANNSGINFEIIVVDDHSTDETSDCVALMIWHHSIPQIKLLRLDSGISGKKNAIRKGLEVACGGVIITRDADTVSGKNWLRSIADRYSSTLADLLICPVRLKGGKGLLTIFQEMENGFLQVFTGGMALCKNPVLCNGANLVFKKTSFLEVGGYDGNAHIPSGDDIFLMEKFRSQKKFKIDYLKDANAEVATKSVSSFREFIHQKTRWAGKFSFRMNFFSSLAALIIFFTNILLLIGCLLLLFHFQQVKVLLLVFMMKAIIDFLIITFFTHGKMKWFSLPLFVFLEVLNLLYTPSIALLSMFIKPVWKGRTVSV